MWAFTSIGLVPADTQLANTTNPETDAADSSTVKDEDLTREVNVNDLHNIYRQAQKLDRPQTEREPAPGFRVDLRQYQKEALAIMMEMESDGEKSTGANGEPILSPLWRRFVFPNTEKVFFMNPYTGELSLKCVPMEKCRGGILADEQGLGKTIETLALIYSNQPNGIHKYDSTHGSLVPRVGTGRNRRPLLRRRRLIRKRWHQEAPNPPGSEESAQIRVDIGPSALPNLAQGTQVEIPVSIGSKEHDVCMLPHPDTVHIVLGKPTSGLDTFTAYAVIKILSDLAKGGRTIIVTIHS
ncbi:hypothetical protein SeMB42_g01857 [Synchytrium endobioticum]|uniref:SNF2 N-terminal domain-containing protein n=1 Tax=Synchytrium endobioticum TaxID=286115 RepID=A0A507DIX8_9FUNG|nr:hypothetical protein SeMB42_g01857 [Synchytrium endobioticum]